MYFSVDQLGAWCRSSPGGGTHFQNPNFEISSFFALWSVPAALRNPQKNMIPDFSSILALLACLRRFETLKKVEIRKMDSPGRGACTAHPKYAGYMAQTGECMFKKSGYMLDFSGMAFF